MQCVFKSLQLDKMQKDNKENVKKCVIDSEICTQNPQANIFLKSQMLLFDNFFGNRNCVFFDCFLSLVVNHLLALDQNRKQIII